MSSGGLTLTIERPVTNLAVTNSVVAVLQVRDFGVAADRIPITMVSRAGDLLVGAAPDTVGILHIGNDGEALIADSGESLGVRWGTPTAGTGSAEMTNKSGAQRVAGELVCFNKAVGNSFVTSTKVGDRTAFAIVLETIAADAEGTVAVGASVLTVNVQGNVAIGDALIQSATAGRAKSNGTSRQPGFIGFALTAYSGGGAGTVSCLFDPEFARAGASASVVSVQTGSATGGANVTVPTDLGSDPGEKLVLGFVVCSGSGSSSTFDGNAVTVLLSGAGAQMEVGRYVTSATGTFDWGVSGTTGNTGAVVVVIQGHDPSGPTGTVVREEATGTGPAAACTDAVAGDLVLSVLAIATTVATDLSGWGSGQTQILAPIELPTDVYCWAASIEDAASSTEQSTATLGVSRTYDYCVIPVHLG